MSFVYIFGVYLVIPANAGIQKVLTLQIKNKVKSQIIFKLFTLIVKKRDCTLDSRIRGNDEENTSKNKKLAHGVKI